MPRLRSRAGGALYPVLLCLGILVFLGAMIPQILVQASMGIRQDRGRDALVIALESGVAFAEARLKQELSDALLVMVDKEPQIQPFECYPFSENPDFGPKKDYDWRSRLVAVPKIHDLLALEGSPVVTYTYAYRIQARAWSTRKDRRADGTEVNGLISVRVLVDKGQSGVAKKAIEGVSFESMNEARPHLALGPSVKP